MSLIFSLNYLVIWFLVFVNSVVCWLIRIRYFMCPLPIGVGVWGGGTKILLILDIKMVGIRAFWWYYFAHVYIWGPITKSKLLVGLGGQFFFIPKKGTFTHVPSPLPMPLLSIISSDYLQFMVSVCYLLSDLRLLQRRYNYLYLCLWCVYQASNVLLWDFPSTQERIRPRTIDRQKIQV